MRANEFIVDEGWKDVAAAGAMAGAMALGGTGNAHALTNPHANIHKNAQTVQQQKVEKSHHHDSKSEKLKKAEDNKIYNSLMSNHPANEEILQRTARSSGIKGEELAAFLAQCAHESDGFKSLKERFNGDPQTYFTHKYDIRYNPNKAKELGNTHPGDGLKYFGRGFIHLTGRYNYKMAGDAIGVDLEKHPELAAKPNVAAKAAVWFWKNHVQPGIRNFSDTVKVTSKVNPGMAGLSDRKEYFNNYNNIVALLK